MSKWEKFKFNLIIWGVPVGAISIIIAAIFGVCKTEQYYRENYDYKVNIMDSKDGTTYYCQGSEIEIVDGVLFIKPNNITTTQFVITKLEKDND